MKNTKLDASSLKTTLTVLIFILFAITAAGFYFAQDYLNQYAIETSKIDTQPANGSLSLSQLQQSVNDNKKNGDLAASLLLSQQDYKQRTIDDLTKYASDTGISIKSSAWADQSDAAPATVVSGAIVRKQITITLGNPVSTNSLVQFLKAIETNLPKMQPTSLTITPVAGKSNTVTVDPITIEVYTR